MASSIPAAMLAEMQGQNRVHPTFDLTLAGTTLRYAEEPVAAESQGMYKPYVVDWGTFPREAGYADFSFVHPKSTIVVFDQERDIQKLVGGPARRSLRGSSCATHWRSFHVPAASHYKDFEGIVDDVGMVGDREYQFSIAMDLSLLDTETRIPKLSRGVWPTAPLANVGDDLFVVYGELRSTLQDPPSGRVQLVPLDVNASTGKTDRWFTGMAGSSALQIWVNGTISRRANWTNSGGVLPDGAFYTFVLFSSNAPDPTDTVMADIVGLLETGPISGDVMFNPAKQMRHFLANFAMGGPPNFSWETETGKPIASAVFDGAESYFDNRAVKAGWIVKSSENVLTVLNRWCANFGAVPFLTDANKVAAIPEDAAETSIYLDGAHIAEHRHNALSKLLMDTNRVRSFDRFDLSYGPDNSLKSFVKDPDGAIQRKAPITFDMIDSSRVDRT